MKLNFVSVIVTFLLSFLFLACNSSKKIAKAPKDPIEGTWVVKAITIEGLGGKVNATAFDEADYTCFAGSIWKFNAADKSGEFFLVNDSADCKSATRSITWKIIGSGEQGRKIEFTKNPDSSLYTLDIISMNSDTMQLKYEIPNITFFGKPMAILYSFSKA